MIEQQQLNQLYRYCYALSLHRDNAYDLLQTALEKYLRHPARNKHQEMAYLRRIIRNQFIDNTRRDKRIGFESYDELGNSQQNVENDVLAIGTQGLENLLINEQQIEQIWLILDASEREIIFLWAVEGYTAAEIASELEIPRGTVLSKIHRLRKKVLASQNDDMTTIMKGNAE